MKKIKNNESDLPFSVYYVFLDLKFLEINNNGKQITINIVPIHSFPSSEYTEILSLSDAP